VVLRDSGFRERFCAWATKQAREEILYGYPRLSGTQSRASRKVVKFFSSLSEADRVSLIEFSVHKAFGMSDRAVSGEELFELAMRAILAYSTEDELQHDLVSRRELRRAVVTGLEVSLGCSPEKFTPSAVVLATKSERLKYTQLLNLEVKRNFVMVTKSLAAKREFTQPSS
jgi:hypothetical protein